MYYTTYKTVVGLITLVSDGESLVGLWIEKQKYFCSKVKENLIKKDNLPIFKIVKKWLDAYFRGENPHINILNLQPIGTLFQKEVWEILKTIPYGETTTYKDIKEKYMAITNKKMANQAIGNAISKNPISIIIPCHRVIGSDGSLTGYAGGLDLKRKLLLLEQNSLNKSS